MLDTPEPGNTTPEASNSNDSGVSAESQTPAAPRRRRRAASRPAGPPVAASAEDTQSTESAKSTPERPADEPPAAAEPGEAAPARATTRRRATRKATAPAGPPKSAEAAEAAGPEPQPEAEAAPARTPRRRATRKAAAPAEAAPAETAAEAVEAPQRTRRTRKRVAAEVSDDSRRLKPGALAPKESEPEPAPAEAATEAEEAPQPTRRRATRKATAPAGAPSFADTDDEVKEPLASMAAEEDVSEEPVRGRRRAVRPPTAVFQPPVFTAPEAAPAAAAHDEEEELETAPRRRRRRRATAEETAPAEEPKAAEETAEETAEEEAEPEAEHEDETGERPSRRRRRGGRRRRRGEAAEAEGEEESETEAAEGEEEPEAEDEETEYGTSTSRRRRRRRRRSGDAAGEPEPAGDEDGVRTVVKIREPRKKKEEPSDEVQSIKGSTRLEAKKQRRREGREQGRRRVPIITEAEFLARREAVERVMVVRESGERTQIGVLEDDVLVEHFVNKEQATSYVGNVYLGKVQNVLPSMEAAFVDIGKGRNAVLYAGEVNFEALGLAGGPRRIESALKSGQSVLVQVTKDPIGHKGARLTSQVSLPGRYLVYVPEGSMTGISRKLPDTERARLKQILKKIVPEDAGVIVRTAAEGASEDELRRDVERLQAQWEEIQKKAKNGNAPTLLYGEPDMTVRVVRDIFNEDFSKVIISGDNAWETIHGYVSNVAPDLVDRLQKWTSDVDVFATYRIDEQLLKALDRKVWLPSGGSLVIDRTEAMVVIDVNTGKFTGQGGNLEETVTRNNLEAAEEIVRQLRLRDLGGIIVIDFIDMVLESNRDLVMRRLLECLGRDRTKHQVAEVTSLGLIQMTRKRVGQGLLESFSETCVHCNGRGVIVHMDQATTTGGGGKRKKKGRAAAALPEAEVVEAAEVVEPVEVTEHELVPAIGGDEEWFGSPAEAEAAAAAPRGRRRATRAASAPAGSPKPVEEPAEAEVVIPASAPAPVVPEPEAAPEPVRPRRRARKATAPAGSPKAAEEAAAAEVIVVPSAPAAEAPEAEAASAEAAPAAEAVEPEPVRPRRRARKASAPAGPPPASGDAAVVVVPAAPAAEEETAEEAAPKKRAARKTATKKVAAKKTAVKKTTTAKKTAAKKTTTAKKATTAKKSAAKKAAAASGGDES
ncbi:Rne/Rng family ribonuclease [Streptantibioticus ferralitis]|uniref:Rne/Rng family ribonuclease n=1 Tax=Streptantibioticus ferralitis TaxID=236510 RepID=A0ABT5Z2Q8_9ACTN|nr:Rne/Rng family ribonuclease [Streptantibioticus ferralitis]MDF2258117.1 Rne/Rng family ribonuclease [Streptantibioticus ferralitis]